jgi:hypothetical protein
VVPVDLSGRVVLDTVRILQLSSTYSVQIRVFIVVTSQQIFYETTAELGAGEELLLGPREPLQLDMFGESTTASEDRSDRETGEFDCPLCGLLTGRSALALINGTSQRVISASAWFADIIVQTRESVFLPHLLRFATD